jgi:hypothetical protein
MDCRLAPSINTTLAAAWQTEGDALSPPTAGRGRPPCRAPRPLPRAGEDRYATSVSRSGRPSSPACGGGYRRGPPPATFEIAVAGNRWLACGCVLCYHPPSVDARSRLGGGPGISMEIHRRCLPLPPCCRLAVAGQPPPAAHLPWPAPCGRIADHLPVDCPVRPCRARPYLSRACCILGAFAKCTSFRTIHTGASSWMTMTRAPWPRPSG